jgi:V8-like Glu-specific endopeptidase
MTKSIRLLATTLAAGFIAASLAGEASAQSPRKIKAPPENARSAERQWTPERLRNAKPLPLPRAKGETKAAPEGKAAGPVVIRRGRAPTIDVEPSDHRLFVPKKQTQADDGVQPRQTSPYGAFFTTMRVFPVAATKAYPYRPAGKLFFHDPQAAPPGDFICSASVIDRRLVLTAGHCVYNPEPAGSANDYFFEDFLFVPSYNVGNDPFGSWDWSQVIVSGEWTGGNGSLPNAQDVAILQIADQDIQGGSAKEKIGDVTGTLGFATQFLKKQHVTMIGWPGNLDGGERMISSHAEAFKNVTPNAVEFGSAMKGGSSGGPWIVDFGVRPSGQNLDIDNLVVSVTSYQPGNVNNLFLGGSILNDSFIDMYEDLCDDAAANCF